MAGTPDPGGPIPSTNNLDLVPSEPTDRSPLILFFSDISWDGLHQRPQHFALALAQRWPVLWIEPAVLTRRPQFTPTAVQANIFRMSLPVIPYYARFRFVKAVAKTASRSSFIRLMMKRWQRSVLKKALRCLGMADARKAVILQNFHVIDLLDDLQPVVVLYDYIDNVFGFTDFPPHVEVLWKRTLTRADIVTVSSPALARQVQAHGREGSLLIGNGVEYSLFADTTPTERPSDLPSGMPIVCYVGAVYPWLDFKLMEFVSKELPQLHFVFIGPVHPSVTERIKPLSHRSNVRFLGVKPYQTIPAYLRHVDVGIIPFQRNALTLAVNPVKLYEYSAAGKPTVITNFPEDVAEYRPVISIANSPQHFVSLVVDALARSRDQNVVASLRAFALHHDWQRKTGELILLIEKSISLPTIVGKDVHGKK